MLQVDPLSWNPTILLNQLLVHHLYQNHLSNFLLQLFGVILSHDLINLQMGHGFLHLNFDTIQELPNANKNNDKTRQY